MIMYIHYVVIVMLPVTHGNKIRNNKTYFVNNTSNGNNNSSKNNKNKNDNHNDDNNMSRNK